MYEPHSQYFAVGRKPYKLTKLFQSLNKDCEFLKFTKNIAEFVNLCNLARSQGLHMQVL